LAHGAIRDAAEAGLEAQTWPICIWPGWIWPGWIDWPSSSRNTVKSPRGVLGGISWRRKPFPRWPLLRPRRGLLPRACPSIRFIFSANSST